MWLYSCLHVLTFFFFLPVLSGSSFASAKYPTPKPYPPLLKLWRSGPLCILRLLSLIVSRLAFCPSAVWGCTLCAYVEFVCVKLSDRDPRKQWKSHWKHSRKTNLDPNLIRQSRQAKAISPSQEELLWGFDWRVVPGLWCTLYMETHFFWTRVNLH